jgi:hypothetical protein
VKFAYVETSSTLKSLMDELNEPAYQRTVADAIEVVDALHHAIERKKKWQEVSHGGTAQGLELQETRLAEIHKELYRLHERRGDFVNNEFEITLDNVPINSGHVAAALPSPLKTGDIARCFAGLYWLTEKAWKKALGDKPNWLDACLVRPGSRGGTQRHWNPVLIGAALVERCQVKPNSVRAKFQTNLPLQPWIEQWKSYESDNLSGQ